MSRIIFVCYIPGYSTVTKSYGEKKIFENFKTKKKKNLALVFSPKFLYYILEWLLSILGWKKWGTIVTVFEKKNFQKFFQKKKKKKLIKIKGGVHEEKVTKVANRSYRPSITYYKYRYKIGSCVLLWEEIGLEVRKKCRFLKIKNFSISKGI